MTDHLSDDVLVRRADGELGDGETERVGRHLSGCARCRGALAEIEALSRRFSRAVTLLDPPASRLSGGSVPRPLRVPARRSGGSPLWRVAAVVALIAGLALAIPPVRAWMADRLGLSPETPTEMPLGDEVPGAIDRTPGDLRVAFMPDTDRFVVRVASPQARGRLLLIAAPGEEAVAEIETGEGGAELFVLPNGIAIRNQPGATADYRVSIPASLASVEVRIGDWIAWSGSGARLRGAPVTVPLSTTR